MDANAYEILRFRGVPLAFGVRRSASCFGIREKVRTFVAR